MTFKTTNFFINCGEMENKFADLYLFQISMLIKNRRFRESNYDKMDGSVYWSKNG